MLIKFSLQPVMLKLRSVYQPSSSSQKSPCLLRVLPAVNLKIISLLKACVPHLERIPGVDFTQIDGMGALTVQTILSEVGLDARRFPTVKHFTSWLGLCPGSCITGAKVKNSRTRRVVNRAANAFRMAATAAGKTRSALGAFYRRLRTRLGIPKAITATAHKLARIFYRLWSSGGTYDDPGVNYYEQRYQEQIIKGPRKNAQVPGFDLVAAC